MGTFVHQASFAAGEIGPELWGRVDQELYFIGMKTILNFMISQYGGAYNRPGTYISAETKDSTKKCRLIRFSFNDLQTYQLEMGHQYMRVLKDGAHVVETAVNISAITKANPCVVTAVGHGYSNGQDVYLSGILGMVELNGRTVRIKNITANTFELTDFLGNNINSTNYTTYASGGTSARIYTVVTPYEEDDLFDLNFAQNNNKLTIVHEAHYPRDISRTAHDAWTIDLFANVGGPFQDINATSTTVYLSAATGSGVTMTASAALFDTDMVGELFYLEQGPDDVTKAWEAGKNIRSQEIRRAGSHYYKAETITGSATITGVSAAARGIVTAVGHGFITGDYVYITGILGMVELNDQWYYVKKISNNTFYLMDPDNSTVYTDTSGYAAYSSAGTAEKGKQTGATKPDWTEGTRVDGDPGIAWTYLHSGFGIVEITGHTSSTVVTVDVINRAPDNVVGSGGASENWSKAAWSESQGYPQAVAYHKRRFWLAATVEQPSTAWASGIGLRAEFGTSNPLLDDEAITLKFDTNDLNAIRHLLPLKELITLTSSSEQLVRGNNNGGILATEPPNPEVQGYTGASKVMPIIIGNTAIMVQDMGSTLRSIQYQLDSDSFGGIDLSARSPHLFRKKTIVAMSYQRHPASVIWCVFDDGTMAGLTFVSEQKVYAWFRVDTDGTFEDVSSIREGMETATYMVIKRTINGVSRRYIERFASRQFDAVKDGFFVDSGATYDGRNESAVTITLSNGSTWDSADELTITASSSIFLAAHAGSTQMTFRDGNNAYKINLTGYTSGTVMTGYPVATVPVAYQGVARTDWEFAKKSFFPLWHIEGKAVSILADGNVVTGKTVTNGTVTLDDPAAVVHIGLPYTAKLETLDMAQPSGNTKARTLTVPRIVITARDTVGLKVGTRGFASCRLVRQRDVLDGYDGNIATNTSLFDVVTDSQWSSSGRICIMQDAPLPAEVLCISPEVIIGSN